MQAASWKSSCTYYPRRSPPIIDLLSFARHVCLGGLQRQSIETDGVEPLIRAHVPEPFKPQTCRPRSKSAAQIVQHDFVNERSTSNSTLRCTRWSRKTAACYLPRRAAYDMDNAASTPDSHFDIIPNGSDKRTRRRKAGEAADAEGGSDSSSMTGSEDFEMDDIDSVHGLDDDEETGLTSNIRRQRTRRKRRNTQLDERIVPDLNMQKEEDRLTNRKVWTTILMNALLIGLWYSFSISISVVSNKASTAYDPKANLGQYNKWMFKDEGEQEKIVFPFPLFTTCVHMIVQFTLASLVLLLLPRFRPRRGHIHDPHSFHSHQPDRNSSPPPLDKPLMTKWFYATRIGPCGAATGLDIGLGNMSLKFISLTFYSTSSPFHPNPHPI